MCRAEKYYGSGYQDVRARRPWIKNTVEELGWKPDVDMPTRCAGCSIPTRPI